MQHFSSKHWSKTIILHTRCKDREDHNLNNTYRANLRMSVTHQTIHKILLKLFLIGWIWTK